MTLFTLMFRWILMNISNVIQKGLPFLKNLSTKFAFNIFTCWLKDVIFNAQFCSKFLFAIKACKIYFISFKCFVNKSKASGNYFMFQILMLPLSVFSVCFKIAYITLKISAIFTVVSFKMMIHSFYISMTNITHYCSILY